MAYTVSEYNHPAPIVYAAEGFPMIAAMAAFQAWDGVFSFAYCHNSNFEPRRVSSYFDIKSDTAKLVHMPACFSLFVRGDAEPARKLLSVPLSHKTERDILHQTQSPWNLTAEHLGVDPRHSLLHAVALDSGKEEYSAQPAAQPTLADGTDRLVSDTGQLRWDVSQKGAGYFIADTPRTKLFTGFVRGRTFQLGDVKLTIGPTRLDWATVSMVCIDGEGFGKTGRVLVAATGWTQNSGAKFEELGGDRVTLRRQWGEEPILCEGIPADIVLPVAADRVQVYALDESGNRRNAVPVTSADGKAQLTLTPQHETVWYEVLIR